VARRFYNKRSTTRTAQVQNPKRQRGDIRKAHTTQIQNPKRQRGDIRKAHTTQIQNPKRQRGDTVTTRAAQWSDFNINQQPLQNNLYFS